MWVKHHRFCSQYRIQKQLPATLKQVLTNWTLAWDQWPLRCFQWQQDQEQRATKSIKPKIGYYSITVGAAKGRLEVSLRQTTFVLTSVADMRTLLTNFVVTEVLFLGRYLLGLVLLVKKCVINKKINLVVWLKMCNMILDCLQIYLK